MGLMDQLAIPTCLTEYLCCNVFPCSPMDEQAQEGTHHHGPESPMFAQAYHLASASLTSKAASEPSPQGFPLLVRDRVNPYAAHTNQQARGVPGPVLAQPTVFQCWVSAVPVL